MARPCLLVLTKHFVQGYGGTPESVLMLAQHLTELDIAVDVLANEGFIRDVGRLPGLPALPDLQAESATICRLEAYRGLWVVGAWNPRALPWAVKARRKGVPAAYAPKGNLCRIEFTRLRDLKKLPYLLLVEAPAVLACRRVIFSSRKEQEAFVLPSLLRLCEPVIAREPYHGGLLAAAGAPSEPAPGSVTFGFLAEVSPRKGVAELVRGFLGWLNGAPDVQQARLVIAGEARPGSERYLQTLQGFARSHPQGDRITWLGPQRGAERGRFYDTVDVFVAPSRFESFGLTPLEALWRGKPVVCAPEMGVLEYLPETPAVYRLRELSEAAVAKGLAEVWATLPPRREAAAAWRGRTAPTLSGTGRAAAFARNVLGSKRLGAGAIPEAVVQPSARSARRMSIHNEPPDTSLHDHRPAAADDSRTFE